MPHRLRWFSPKDEEWHDETYLATFVEQDDLLRLVVEYGRERGVTVIPFVNSFGHNTYFARVMPELSAKDKDGEPTGVGYCITSPETRKFVEEFYESILTRYFVNRASEDQSVDYFHIQMDEVWPDYPWPDDATKVGDPWCQCECCQKQAPEKNLLDYVFWLVQMLTSKGVRKVVMWNDQLTRHMSAFDASFVERLKAAGLQDKLILHWWWYSNQALNDNTRVSIGKELGIEGWVAPMTCYYNWNTYDYRLPNIDLMMQMAEKEGASGTVSYAVHDPSHLDHEALMAAYAWESGVGQTQKQVLDRWCVATLGQTAAEKYFTATEKLRTAVQKPGYGHCLNYAYTYFRKGQWPRKYPQEALEALETNLPDQDVLANLNASATLATEAEQIFNELLEQEGLSATALACLRSLRGDTVRVKAYAQTFIWLLELRQALEPGMIRKSMATACQKVKDDLIAQMAIFEESKPDWVVPASLQALSTVLAFLEQLEEELNTHAGRKRAKDLNWYLLPKQPEEVTE